MLFYRATVVVINSASRHPEFLEDAMHRSVNSLKGGYSCYLFRSTRLGNLLVSCHVGTFFLRKIIMLHRVLMM